MSVRRIETDALVKSSTVNRAVATVQNEGAILAAARGAANVGVDGEVATVPIEPWPEIDPETGDFEEPIAPLDWFRAGGVVGVAPVRPGSYRGGDD